MARAVIFAKTEVTKNLSLIVKRYEAAYNDTHSATNVRLMHLYSGMAIITLSSYLEDGMDELVNVALRGLSQAIQEGLQKNQRYEFNGASYKHLRKRIEAAFGSHGLDFIESYVGTSDVAILKSTLGTLGKLRNEVAHSHKRTIHRNPNSILSDFNKIYPILKKVEKAARLYRDRHFV